MQKLPAHSLRGLALLCGLCVLASEDAWRVKATMAGTWVCSRPGQSDLYTDRGGPGCRELGDVENYSSLQVSPNPVATPPAAATSRPVPPSTPAEEFRPRSTIAPSFAEVSLSFPVLAVTQPTPGVITGSWNGHLAYLTVGYLTQGNGPEILTDGNLRRVALASLHTAVAAAARAVGYDARYLRVRLLIPTPVDGPSAGSMYAVAIASALLGDPIRPDVCMSGTIEPTLEIKPVGRLADKMNACRTLKKTVMIVPDGLDNSNLSFNGAERGIHVVEVHTLAEAYAAATGHVLRQMPSF